MTKFLIYISTLSINVLRRATMKENEYKEIEKKISNALNENEKEFSLETILKKNKKVKKDIGALSQSFIHQITLLTKVLTKSTEIKNKISNCKEISVRGMNHSEQSLDKLIEFIKFLKNDELLSKPRIEVDSDMNFYDRIIIEIKTGVNVIDNSDHFEKSKYQLLKNLWKKLENGHFDENSLKPMINEVIEEVKQNEKINLNYHNCLRILSEFEWSKLSQNHAELNISFKNLFKQEEVKSQYYHYKKEDDLHFYMVKVTEKNAHSWKEFKNHQFSADILRQYFRGLTAFIPSLDFFDYDKTDVWVAFIANQELDLDQINRSSIEMCVTMITSENASFTSHSGISRCPTYQGKEHQKISSDLHSFIANATLKNYPDQEKSYMITCPVSGTREIIIENFEKSYNSKYYYIGDEVVNSLFLKYPPNPPKYLQVQTQIEKLIERINTQNEQIKNGNKKILIKLNTESDEDNIALYYDVYSIIEKCTSFEIFNQDGEILQTISSEMMKNEFAWFFNHPYLFRGQNLTETLLTTDMKALASLININPSELEYVEKIEVIGEAELY